MATPRIERPTKQDFDDALRGKQFVPKQKPKLMDGKRITEFTDLPQFQKPAIVFEPGKPHQTRPWGYKGRQFLQCVVCRTFHDQKETCPPFTL